ncbi:hypothetical protein GCM10022380_73240 [Amycolatopsis tucumanensis]|uniref:Uncharacterized protein n=1 Tax=Amycolatopsis tucumanensis TaxID=401106 RepID=A0ABP7JGA1_9PSEU
MHASRPVTSGSPQPIQLPAKLVARGSTVPQWPFATPLRRLAADRAHLPAKLDARGSTVPQ